MTLQQIRNFLSIIEHGSFRRAADALHLSQAGLTNSIHALESSLGVALLRRSAQGVSLTQDGQSFLPRAQFIDREAKRAIEEAQFTSGKRGGTLNVGIGPTPTALLLPFLVPDFHVRFPSVQLKLASGFYEQLHPALQQGKIQLAITAVPSGNLSHGLVSKVLFKSDLAVICRKGHPLSEASFLHELALCEWILLGDPGGPGGTAIIFHKEQGLPKPRIAATCESFTQLIALLIGTDWLAIVPVLMLERGLLGNQVTQITLHECLPNFENCLIYKTEPPLTHSAAAFASMCESFARMIEKTSPLAIT